MLPSRSAPFAARLVQHAFLPIWRGTRTDSSADRADCPRDERRHRHTICKAAHAQGRRGALLSWPIGRHHRYDNGQRCLRSGLAQIDATKTDICQREPLFMQRRFFANCVADRRIILTRIGKEIASQRSTPRNRDRSVTLVHCCRRIKNASAPQLNRMNFGSSNGALATGTRRLPLHPTPSIRDLRLQR